MTCRLGNRTTDFALYSLALQSIADCSTSSPSALTLRRCLRTEKQEIAMGALHYFAASINVFEIYMSELKQVKVLVDCRVGAMQAS